jgi:hypothetical protein
VIGWLESEDRPAAYSMNMFTEGSSQIARVLANSPNAATTQFFKLTEQTGLAGTPLPGLKLLDAAGFKILDDDNDYHPEIDLLHLVEVQRHEQIEGAYWVGGKAVLTSIDRRGITQRVLHHWPEDEIGKPIAPLPIDWRAWRASRASAAAESVAPPPGMSKLQRDMWTKKQLKLARKLEQR